MSKGIATIVFMFGFLLVAMGVGGIDDSIDNFDLLASTAVSVLGLASMFFAKDYLGDDND